MKLNFKGENMYYGDSPPNVQRNRLVRSETVKSSRIYPNLEGDAKTAGARLQKAIDEEIAKHADKDIFRLTEWAEDDEVCFAVKHSRLETEEEREKRVIREEKYRAGWFTDRERRREAAARKKELERLTAHLDLETLQSLQPLLKGKDDA